MGLSKFELAFQVLTVLFQEDHKKISHSTHSSYNVTLILLWSLGSGWGGLGIGMVRVVSISLNLVAYNTIDITC